MSKSEIKPIYKRQVSKATIDRLLSMISEGYWSPGDQLPPQRELARALGIGMSTLREAIQSLHTIGILEVRHGEGTYVTDRKNGLVEKQVDLSLAVGDLDLQMLFEARGILEPGFAYYAATRATESQATELFQILEQERQAIINGKKEEMYGLDLAFHRKIAEMAANKFLLQIEGSLIKALDNLLQELPLTLEGWSMHYEVAVAIRNHNAFQASEAMRTLIEASAARYLPTKLFTTGTDHEESADKQTDSQ
jgi:DNA-binding FadR family transcriptional regulator